MATLDPRTPVLVGAGQLSQRVDRGEPDLSPTRLMAEAARRAAIDAGLEPGALTGLDAIRVVRPLSWRYRDPGLLVAEHLGASPGETAVSAMGGNSPQSIVNLTCEDIQRGGPDLVLVTGAEAWRTRMSTRSAGVTPEWERQGDEIPEARILGEESPLNAPGELARGLAMPVQIYPLFEQALRIAAGRDMAEHLAIVSKLWARFSEIAAGNPHAWIRQARTAEEIGTPTADNRLIGFPYTKLMNSNNAVEQGAALLLCSAERASSLGVPPDRCVFPWAGTDAHDHQFVSERWELHRSPAIRIAGQRSLELAGVGPDDLAHVDLYSCFPSAVQVAAAELGLGLDRDLTVTGGLSFAGGPWNDYVTHAIATMAGVLRDDPAAVGLVSANGGYLTKHAFGVYSATPPSRAFRHAEPQDDVDALPRRALCEEHDGEATIESWTVMHDREGRPETGIVANLLDDGRRAWATSRDPAIVAALLTDDVAGRRVKIRADGDLEL
jgi:acetyl-CoA C-acetyltransferase